MAHQRRGRCSECDEVVDGELVSGILRCTTCGSVITTIQSNENGQHVREVGVEELFERLTSRNQAASKKTLSTLKRIKPDARYKALEPQVEVRVSGIQGECLGVPASFGTMASLSERPIRLCEPLTANTEILQNANDLKGCIAVVMRGGNVSFAFKALTCQRAGAVGVILIQTFEVWPFTPTDSTGEIEKAGGLSIPMIAISAESGKRLIDHMQGLSKSSTAGDARIRASLTLKSEEKDYICAICHDDLVDNGEEEPITIIQLPCLHYFHEHCAIPWLESKNTCPNCRYQLPLESGAPLAGQLQQEDRGTLLGWFS